ncbi:MAG: Rrf2 family transcriptional regulator [Bacteroidales bacterium]|nr:Rrf2 family transcriptional regulator [Bacteroidales bacterium]
MTLLSRKADYALLILSYLHQKQSGGNAREIAERFRLSRPFVANILKELCHKGYVTSHRGVKGGYVLHPATISTSLAELLDAIEEGFRLTLCSPDPMNVDPCCLEQDCPVKAPLGEIHRRIIEILRGVTLGELFPQTIDPATAPHSLLSLLMIRESHTHTAEPTSV